MPTLPFQRPVATLVCTHCGREHVATLAQCPDCGMSNAPTLNGPPDRKPVAEFLVAMGVPPALAEGAHVTSMTMGVGENEHDVTTVVVTPDAPARLLTAEGTLVRFRPGWGAPWGEQAPSPSEHDADDTDELEP